MFKSSQEPEACNFIKKRHWHRCFPVNFAKFLRTPFLQKTSGRLLLKINLVKLFGNNHSYVELHTVTGVHPFECPIYWNLSTFPQLINVAKVESQSISIAIFWFGIQENDTIEI